MVIIVMRYKNICIYSVHAADRLREKMLSTVAHIFSTLFLYSIVYFASDWLHETRVTYVVIMDTRIMHDQICIFLFE